MSAAAPPGFEAIRERGLRALAARDHLPALRAAGLLDPRGVEAALAGADGARGRGPTARVTAPPGLRLVLRAFRRGGLLGARLGSRLGDALAGPGRPLREVEVCAALRREGAPVPEPVLAIAWRRAPGWRGAVATRLEAGAGDGLAFLASRPDADRLRAALRAAGRAVRAFHDAGGSHADLHVKNLLVREGPGGCEVLVIDLDRARRLPAVPARRRAAELMRLYRSLHKRRVIGAVGERGCAAFWHAYWGGDRGLRSAVARHLPRERRRAARHIRAYRRP